MKVSNHSKVRRSTAAVCVSNAGYEASLEPRKIYRVLPDADASRLDLLRVVDESGEDYLYPAAMFRAIALPPGLRRALRFAAR